MNPRTYDDYVLQILKTGNMTRAAAELGISQPALSYGLTRLEGELGFRIFDRQKVPIAVSPEGELYIDYIRRLRLLSEDLDRRLADLRGSGQNRVVVGGPIAYIEFLVADAVVRLLSRHDDYRVEMKAASLAELLGMAEKGEIDCFIATTGELPDHFERRLIKRERIYLFVPREFPVNQALVGLETEPGATGECFDYSLLKGNRFICMQEGQPLQVQLDRFAGEYGLDLDGSIRVNQVSTAVAMANRGMGMCFASEDSLRGGADISRLCVYSLPADISGRDIYVAYERGLYMTRACAAFIELLGEGVE